MESSDNCRNCGFPCEIVYVGFRLTGAVMIATCPNCSMILQPVSEALANDHLAVSRFAMFRKLPPEQMVSNATEQGADPGLRQSRTWHCQPAQQSRSTAAKCLAKRNKVLELGPKKIGSGATWIAPKPSGKWSCLKARE
jgi:hypothetical protein